MIFFNSLTNETLTVKDLTINSTYYQFLTNSIVEKVDSFTQFYP